MTWKETSHSPEANIRHLFCCGSIRHFCFGPGHFATSSLFDGELLRHFYFIFLAILGLDCDPTFKTCLAN